MPQTVLPSQPAVPFWALTFLPGTYQHMTMNLSPSSPHTRATAVSAHVSVTRSPTPVPGAACELPTRTTAMNRVEDGEQGGILRAGGQVVGGTSQCKMGAAFLLG